MSWLVTNDEGATFELVAERGAGAFAFGGSLRAVLDHHANVASVLEERTNRRVFEQALVSLGVVSSGHATSMAFDELQGEMRQAVSTGALHLVPYVRELRPVCEMVEIEPEELVDEEPDEEPVQSEQTHWVELTFHDADGNPLADVDCRVQRPDGVVHEGRTDATGTLWVGDISIAGECTVSFPGLEDYVRENFEMAR